MKLQKVVGATSEIWQVFIRDSSSTTGAGLTGLVYNSASLTAYYHRDTDTTATAITLVTMTVGTFTSSGFKEIDATNMPGWYQFCPPNAALASGAKSCSFHLNGATNMAPLPIEVQLTAVNPDSATAFMTSVATAVAVTTVNGLANDVITTASINDGAITDAKVADDVKVDVNTIKGQTVTLSGGVTIPAATLASTTNITAGTIATVTNLTNAPTSGDLTATMKTSVQTAATASIVAFFGADAATFIASIWNALTSGMSTVGSIGKKLADWVVGTIDTYTGNTKQTGDAYAEVTNGTYGLSALKTILDAIKTCTDRLTAARATLIDKILYIAATTQGKCVVTLISGSDYTFDHYDDDGTTIRWTGTCTLGGRASITRS